MLTIRAICEGPTDLVVIRAALRAITTRDFQLTMLQPDQSLYGGDAGPHGGGWKGVRGYLQSAAEAGGLGVVGALTPDVDLLVVHLDADVADETEIACACPCPPAMDTIRALESLILGWLGLEAASLPGKLALCIPSKSTEAWILHTLFPNRAPQRSDIECLADPASRLVGGKPKLVRRRGTKIKKRLSEYQSLAPRLQKGWPSTADALESARRFDEDLRRILP